jgi:hypothetical protein
MAEIRSIGFDKKIRYSWMDAVAYWASAGLSPEQIRSKLESLLKDQLADTGERSSLSKVRSILMRIWVSQNDEVQELRELAQTLYPHATENEKLLLHWGLSGATYPFFFQVAEHTGRLLSITQELRSRQVVRRIKEKYGERSTLYYAVPRVVRSFVEWGVLEPSEKYQVLTPAQPRKIEKNPPLVSWFIEALIRATGKQMIPFSSITRSPAVFPFSIEAQFSDVEVNPRLTLYRQNVDEDMVMLRSHL